MIVFNGWFLDQILYPLRLRKRLKKMFNISALTRNGLKYFLTAHISQAAHGLHKCVQTAGGAERFPRPGN